MQINRYALRALREAKGLTVSWSASAAGINQPHLSNIEAGRRQASDDVIDALATVLGVPVQAIVVQPDSVGVAA